MKIGILAITSGGRERAAILAAKLDQMVILDTADGAAKALSENWQAFDGFICIMAAGIVVRSIAPLLSDKKKDPCVVVVDEKGCHSISLLSGHLGGGNALAIQTAKVLGGQPVLTTASDTLGLVPLDLWAQAQNLVADDPKALTRASARLVNTGELKIFSEIPVASLPPGLREVTHAEDADIIISIQTKRHPKATLFHPQALVVGIGCKRNTQKTEFDEAVSELFHDNELALTAIRNLASIDLKNDEKGLLSFAAAKGLTLDFFSKDEINRVCNVDPSEAVMRAVGAQGVAEPSALLSAETDALLIRKRKWKNITMAVAVAGCTLSAQVPAQKNI